MRHFLQLIRFVLFSVTLSFFTNYTFSQTQLGIRNFAIFGGDINASLTDTTRAGVELASNVSVTGGGSIGSQSFLIFQNQVNVDGDLYGSTAFIGNSFRLNGGSISVLNRQNFDERAVLAVGALSNFQSPGNISVKGNTQIIDNGTVQGVVTHPDGTSYSGPVPGNGQSNAVPVFPALPVLPDTLSLPAAGTITISSTQTITPGNYRSINLGTGSFGGQQFITFSGVGSYFFNSIFNLSKHTFIFDFKNNTTGTFKIYVQGNVDLGNIDVSIINGGSASRIYTEVHGTGTQSNGFSFSMNTNNSTSASWAGTVFAQNGAIRIGNFGTGSVNVINGCMWSSTKVLIGRNTSFRYVALSPSVNPTPNSSIFPYYPPPADGKVNTLIGSELTSLLENRNLFKKDSVIYQIKGNTVYIEVIAIKGKYAQALAFLQSRGLTDTVTNGPGSLIITGRFPISRLGLLTNASLFDYIRPLYHPITNSGIVTSQGDTAMRSTLVKAGYDLTGEGVKVGVISDSYNTREISPGVSGNFAGVDVGNGDLPGSTNPFGYTTPVQVIGEYPLGQRSDEGRAMLQIVHDVAPKAPLAFRTGFVSAGDFAQGIGQLGAAGCKVIVDDVTFITEPYFADGVVAQAVDNVVANGTTYFSAAGNFGRKSYEGTFTSILAPVAVRAIAPEAHNFGSAGSPNPLQTLNLTPGVYTIVLQWEDDFYSMGGGDANGDGVIDATHTDLDIFLLDNTGSTLFGFNRNNINTDPLEVLPFTVTESTTANLIIAKAAGVNVRFKLIVFRGDLTFNGYFGSSTIVGQANALGAIAVGAVLYKNTPAYGKSIPTIASFSSWGGARVNNTIRKKPDLTAPNGVNTTVRFNSVDLEHDNISNFFGTSAAAPHAAAAAALIIEGKKKFLNETITPANLKTLLQTTATNMSIPGYDRVTGYGFIDPFAAMQTFASPLPIIDSLETPIPITQPITAPFIVTVKGKGLTTQTKVLFGGAELPTSFVNSETLIAEIPVFDGNPPFLLFNPSIITPPVTTNMDGGFSDTAFFFSPDRKLILIKADNKIKKYGEKLPVFTATVTVDGIPIESSGLTLAGLKLNNLTFASPATTSSNVADYLIRLLDPLDSRIPADAALKNQYDYVFENGILTIERLPLKITPRDTTLTYGQQIHGIDFNYELNPSGNIQNSDSLINAIHLSHSSAVLDSLFALVNGGSGTTRRALVNGDFENMSILVSGGSGTTRRALVNTASGTTETSYIVDVSPESILNYQDDPATSPLVNGGSGTVRRALVNTSALINGTAGILVNGGSGTVRRALVNGDATLLNSNTIGGTSNTNVAVIVSAEDAPDPINNSIQTRAANMITGITAGEQIIIPGAFISSNFEITYGLGKLTINKAPLYVTANSILNDNGIIPPLTSTITGYQYQDASTGPSSGPPSTLMPAYTGMPGTYVIKLSPFNFPGDSNYLKIYTNGTLTVRPYTRAVTSFTLINAQTDSEIQPLVDGSILDINTLPFTKLNVRANTALGKPASVVFILDGRIVRTEEGAPFAIGGDSPPGDFHYWTLPIGEHTLTAIPYASSYGRGLAGPSLTIHFTVTGHKVAEFSLVNSDSGNELLAVAEGTVIELNALPASKLNIKATTNPAKVGSVVFLFDGVKVRTENGAPYAVGGDKPSGDYHSWPLPVGVHTLTAIPYAKPNGQGTPGTLLTVHFTVQQTVMAQRASGKVANSKNEYEIISQKTGVFPNPAGDKITVTTTSQFENQQRITVTDLSGRTYFVGGRTVSAGKIELTITALQKGMYFIKIKDKEGFKRLSFVKL